MSWLGCILNVGFCVFEKYTKLFTIFILKGCNGITALHISKNFDNIKSYISDIFETVNRLNVFSILFQN